MIGRFLYHAFWNFYDHMGTLILWGTAHALIALGLAVVAIGLIPEPSVTTPVVLVISLLELALLIIVLAGLLPYCALAAKGEPARWPAIWSGIQRKWAIVTKILVSATVILAVIGVNIRFYLPLQNAVDSNAVQMLLVFVVAILAWTCLFLYLFLPPWLSAGTFNEDDISLRDSLRKGLMAVALVPGIWLFLGVMSIGLLLGGVYTRIGLVLFIPIMTCFSQTAFRLAAQHADFLTIARDELGDEATLRKIKVRAQELGMEWEHKQPRRTFKELIRPWDY